MVETHKPQNLQTCLEIIDQGFYWKFAGGTDLMIRKRQWAGADRKFKKPIVLIGDLEELKGIRIVHNCYEIGAATSLTDICGDDRLPEYLKKPLWQMASPPIRNIATLGGNICNAAKVADSIPVLFALGAKLVLISVQGQRTLSIKDFILGKYKTALRENELLYKIIVPINEVSHHSYRKLGTRKGSILSKLSFFGIASVKKDIISDFSISIGALNELPLHSKELEDKVIGLSVEELKIKKVEIIELYKSLMQGESDKRSTKVYRERTATRFIEMFMDALTK